MVTQKIKLIEPVVGKEEINEIRKVLLSGWLTEGPKTREFEEEIKSYIGVKHAVATTSCTTALELALRTLGIGRGDEVIIPDFTHPASGNVVKLVGAKPVLVDVDLSSYNIDPTEIEKAVSNKTKCIMPVSWGGNPLDMDPLIELKEKHGLYIVEDAACSLGAEYKGKKTGALADITCFSFHPRKAITTGEGGMAVTNNSEYAQKMQSLKKFGMQIKNNEITFIQLGTNYKLSDILSAVGVAQIRKLEAIIKKRIQLANHYDRLLSKIESIRPPQKTANTKHIYQTYAAYVKKEHARDRIIEDLRKENVEAQIGTYALHLQPFYMSEKRIGKLKNSKKLYMNLLALPMTHRMTQRAQEYVVSLIEKSLNRNRTTTYRETT